jgi:hypothetical protein
MLINLICISQGDLYIYLLTHPCSSHFLVLYSTLKKTIKTGHLTAFQFALMSMFRMVTVVYGAAE